MKKKEIKRSISLPHNIYHTRELNKALGDSTQEIIS